MSHQQCTLHLIEILDDHSATTINKCLKIIITICFTQAAYDEHRCVDIMANIGCVSATNTIVYDHHP
jgi:hypothetical protein